MATAPKINFEKLLKKAQKNPQTAALLAQMQQKMMAGQSMKTETTDPRERIKEKIRQCRLQRGGQNMNKILNDRQQQEEEEKEKAVVDETKVQDDVQDAVKKSIDNVKKQKKKQHDKIRKLNKKFGNISLERYTEALAILNNTSATQDVISNARNIADLYLYQTKTLQEVKLDVGSDADDDDTGDLVDLDA
jgi:hypothetical protein